jgi:hypothetical protein
MTYRMFTAPQSDSPLVAGGMFAERHVPRRTVGEGQTEGGLLVNCCRDCADIRVVAEDAQKICLPFRGAHCLFIDRHTLCSKSMNRCQQVVEIKATPSDDLDFPKGSQIQGIILIHEWHISSGQVTALHGPARNTFGSSHLSIARRIWSGISMSLSYALITVRSLM